MPTYASCVLQTFHRLCKTSESVRPLELWEGRTGRGGGGTGELTGQRSGLQQFTSTHGSNPTLPGGAGSISSGMSNKILSGIKFTTGTKVPNPDPTLTLP